MWRFPRALSTLSQVPVRNRTTKTKHMDVFMKKTPINPSVLDKAASVNSPMCLFSPEQIAGPYFKNDRLERFDITEGAAGVPLQLNLKVLHACTGEPVEGVLVDVWHCNAQCRYSGWSAVDPDQEAPSGEIGAIARTDEDTYLRGCGFTDRHGRREFLTIFPGFYAGRAIHVHAAVRKVLEHDHDRHVAYVGQLYFPELISSQINELPDYAGRKISRLTNAKDEIYSEMDGYGTLMDVGWINRGSKDERLLASAVIGIDPEAFSQHIKPEDFDKPTV